MTWATPADVVTLTGTPVDESPPSSWAGRSTSYGPTPHVFHEGRPVEVTALAQSRLM
jgi:hypothetical protein